MEGATANRIGILGAALICLIGLITSGCSLFHHGDPPQQQFMNALNRGNSAQASQLRLHMSAEDRSNLSHNAGFQQQVSREDLGRALLKHQQAAAQNGEDQDTASDDGDSASQQTAIPRLEDDSGTTSLSNLPAQNSLQQSAPLTTLPEQ